MMFRMIDGSEQSFEGHIVMVEPAGPKPVTVKFCDGDEESYSIEDAHASLVPEECAPPPEGIEEAGSARGRKHDDEQGGKETKDQRACAPGTYGVKGVCTMMVAHRLCVIN